MAKGLVVANVSKAFNKVKVLEDISFAAEAGEFTVLLGPSGCGKSTLLNILAGLEPVSGDGKVFIKDREVTDLTPKERNIAMVFQSYALYPNMTIRENIGFGLKNRQYSKQDLSTIVERVAKILRITDLLERRPSELSGGQRQRVAMGRAISRSPDLYLFDEPLSNLDAKLRVELRLELKLLHQNEKKSIVYVTHDQIEAMTLADKIIILNKGRIMQIGTPLQIYTAPNNVFVATFIGVPTTNIFPTTIEKNTDTQQLTFTLTNALNQSFTIPLKKHVLYDVLTRYTKKRILLGIRAEQLIIVTNNDRATNNTMNTMTSNNTTDRITGEDEISSAETTFSFKARVTAVEFVGSEFYVYFDIDAKRIVAKCSATLAIKRGDVITLRARYESIHFFDCETEERITAES
ncbi:sugar ABC transporter ATP-binding protein [Spirochaetota bacterium]|nr:sugar ABC transporter ATP-binding protein [Spirochaetota bacterium]